MGDFFWQKKSLNTICFGYIKIRRIKKRYLALISLKIFVEKETERKKQVSLYTYKTSIFYKFTWIGLQGVALKYEEEFHQALSSFARAQVSTGRFYTKSQLLHEFIPVSEKVFTIVYALLVKHGFSLYGTGTLLIELYTVSNPLMTACMVLYEKHPWNTQADSRISRKSKNLKIKLNKIIYFSSGTVFYMIVKLTFYIIINTLSLSFLSAVNSELVLQETYFQQR